MALAGGRANLHIAVEDSSAGSYVSRWYPNADWLISEAHFYLAVRACADAGLVVKPECWQYVTDQKWEGMDAVKISNPLMDVLNLNECNASELYIAYEETLANVKTLYKESGLILSDAHEKNLVITRIAGRPRICLIDGKLGGATRDIDMSVGRLRVKLYFAVHRYHKWFLNEYIAFLQRALDDL